MILWESKNFDRGFIRIFIKINSAHQLFTTAKKSFKYTKGCKIQNKTVSLYVYIFKFVIHIVVYIFNYS